MGYLKEAISISARYMRQKKKWAAHLENSRGFVAACAQRCQSRRKAVILGSGTLLDVPLEQLSRLFEEVVLVDVVHLRKTLRRIRKLPNVRTVCRDVTATAEKLYHWGKTDDAPLPEPGAFFPEIDETTDLVVSMNLLSQITYVLGRYASQKMRFRIHGDQTALQQWEYALIRLHYEALRSTGYTACMITDYSYCKVAPDGRLLEEGSTIMDFPLPDAVDNWVWEIAPIGEESPAYGLYRKVAAFCWPEHR